MTVSKMTVSLDPIVAERVRRDVADGKARSVSAWLNGAARAHLQDEDLADVLNGLFEATGGPLTAGEVADARHLLALADQ